jgi:2,3-bisphosphoglycerate-dependent phosphoglycerate mutase
VLVAAHGNSLRAIVKHLFGVADDKITGVEIPTANPLVLDLAAGGAKVVGARYLDAARANTLPSIG